MAILQGVSRRQTWVGTAHLGDIGADPFPDPIVIPLGGVGIAINEGAWTQPVTLTLGGLDVEFDVAPGQSDWLIPLGGLGIQFDNAIPEPWDITLGGFGIGLAADMVRAGDTTPWNITLGGLGIDIPQDWNATLAGMGIQFDTAVISSAHVQYCYNLRSEGGPECTRLTGFDFIKILRVGGVNYGLKTDGIYQIGGETDNGVAIESRFTLSPFVGAKDAEGRAYMSRCPWLHATMNTEADVYTLTDADGTEVYAEDGPYPTSKGRGNARRAQFGKGLRSKLWGFRVESKDGQRLKVSALEFDFTRLSRRI
jgi:hypothetical protein